MQESPFYGIIVQKSRAEGRVEGRAEGIVEGRAEGIVEGEARVYREIEEWDRRRKAAEERGETFTEPLPAPPKK